MRIGYFSGELMTMAKKKGRREALLGVDAMKDLLISCLLPGDRKLR